MEQSQTDEEHLPALMTQALYVTRGPFKGRICENDDDAFVSKSELSAFELKWFKKCKVTWRKVEDEDIDFDESDESKFEEDFYVGVDCEIVSFGFFLQTGGRFYIPRQFLRPATTHDLVTRSMEIYEITSREAWLNNGKLDETEIISYLQEQYFIVNELWRREQTAMKSTNPRNVFLCHSSNDKHFVRKIWSDLVNVGHRPWLDEFEIKVGDSIIDKIESGITEAGYLILFLSSSSIESNWVMKEWNSALARQVSSNNIRVIPALIENCTLPSMLADLKYADFRESYNDGLAELLSGIN
jgi:hypothetical protein